MAPIKGRGVKMSLQELNQGQHDASLMTTTYSQGSSYLEGRSGVDNDFGRGGDRSAYGDRRSGQGQGGFGNSDVTDVWRNGASLPTRESTFGRGDEEFNRDSMKSRQNLANSENRGSATNSMFSRYDASKQLRPNNEDVDFSDVRGAPRNAVTRPAALSGMSKLGFQSSAASAVPSLENTKYAALRVESKASEQPKYKSRAPGSQPMSLSRPHSAASTPTATPSSIVTPVEKNHALVQSHTPPATPSPERVLPAAAAVDPTTPVAEPTQGAEVKMSTAENSAVVPQSSKTYSNLVSQPALYVPQGRKDTTGDAAFAKLLKQKQAEQQNSEHKLKSSAVILESSAKLRQKKMAFDREQKKREEEEKRKLDRIEAERLEHVALTKLMVGDIARINNLEDVVNDGIRTSNNSGEILRTISKILSEEDLESLVPSIVMAKSLTICSLESLRPLVETVGSHASPKIETTDKERMDVVRDIIRTLKPTLEFVFKRSGIKMQKLHFLKAVQMFLHALQFPRISSGLSLVEAVWDGLYMEGVIEEQYFIMWYDDADDGTPGRKQLIFQMLSWFSWLNSAPAEGETYVPETDVRDSDDEEDEEDDL